MAFFFVPDYTAKTFRHSLIRVSFILKYPAAVLHHCPLCNYFNGSCTKTTIRLAGTCIKLNQITDKPAIPKMTQEINHSLNI